MNAEPRPLPQNHHPLPKPSPTPKIIAAPWVTEPKGGTGGHANAWVYSGGPAACRIKVARFARSLNNLGAGAPRPPGSGGGASGEEGKGA